MGLTVEDYLLRDLSVAPLKVVGFVGVLGTVIMAAAVLPVAAVLPGVEGNGLREDTLDTLRMLGSNPVLLVSDARRRTPPRLASAPLLGG